MNSERQSSSHRNSGFQPDRSCRLPSLLFDGRAGCPLGEYSAGCLCYAAHMKTPLEKLGLTDDNAGVFDGEWRGGGATIDKMSPIDGRRLAGIRTASDDDYNKAISRAHEAFLKWRVTPRSGARRDGSPPRQCVA